MKETTRQAIAVLCSADDTIDTADAKRALAILGGETAARHTAETRPLNRREVADLCGVSLQTVSNWGKSGAIRRCALPNQKKALGYVRADVYALLDGERRTA